MSSIKEVGVQIIGARTEKVTAGEVRIQFWDKRERTLRALKFLGLCWGAAIVSVFIPLLHFLLVPAFLIAGPILAYFTYGQESVVLGGKGNCPECEKALPIARGRNRFPLSDLCAHCQGSMRIEKIEMKS